MFSRGSGEIPSEIVVALRASHEVRALVGQLSARGVETCVVTSEARLVAMCRESCPDLIVAESHSGTDGGPVRARNWYPQGQPQAAGILFVVDDGVVPVLPPPFTQQFVGWMHRSVGPSGLANLSCAILLQRLHALWHQAQAESTQLESAKAYHTARFNHLLGNRPVAEQQYRLALGHDALQSDVRRHLARVLIERGEFTEAYEHLDVATRGAGAARSALEDLATVLAHLGREAEAEAVLRRASGSVD